MIRLNSILSFLILVGALNSCKQKKDVPRTEDLPVAVNIIQPKTVAPAYNIVASGVIGNSREINLSFKNPGIISEVLVSEGEYVRKGQLLARMNASDLEAQYQQTALKSAEYERDLNRLQKLVKDTIVTIQQVQNTQTALTSALSQQKALRYNLQNMNLYAPEDGVILRRDLNSGEFKPASAIAFVLGNNENNGRWAFKFSVTDKDRMQLRQAAKVSVELDALPGKTLEGKVFKMGSIPNAGTGTYDCYITLSSTDATLVYGLSGKVIIPFQSATTFTEIPLNVLFDINGKNASLFYVDKKMRVHKKQVRLHKVDLYNALIEDDLPPSMQIISAGKSDLEEGSEVTLSKNIN